MSWFCSSEMLLAMKTSNNCVSLQSYLASMRSKECVIKVKPEQFESKEHFTYHSDGVCVIQTAEQFVTLRFTALRLYFT